MKQMKEKVEDFMKDTMVMVLEQEKILKLKHEENIQNIIYLEFPLTIAI